MPSTTPHGFRYPLDSDPVSDAAAAVRNLANDVDDKVGAFAAGSVTVVLNPGSNGSAAVTFPLGRFAAAPRVVATVNGTNGYVASTNSVTATGFNAVVRQINDVSATANVPVTWIAVDQS